MSVLRSRPWSTIVGLLLGSLVILAIVATAVRFVERERIARRWRTMPVSAGAPILQPEGRRIADDLALAADRLPGIRGHLLELRAGEIRIQLAGPGGVDVDATCPGPDWVRGPGAIVVDQRDGEPTISWHWCDGQGSPARAQAAARLAAQIQARPDLDRIWLRRTRARDPSFVHLPSGLLTPASAALGLDHERLTTTLLLGGLLLSGLVAGWAGPRLRCPGPPISTDAAGTTSPAATSPASRARLLSILRSSAIPILGLLAAARLRLRWAAELPLDSDESWAGPLHASVFHESHDVWVHPPLYHLLQQPWIQAIDWQPGDPLLPLRLPAILAGLGATALLLRAIQLRARATQTWWLAPTWWILALPCLFAERLATDLVLARPYALAALLVMLCAVGLWPASSPWWNPTQRLAPGFSPRGRSRNAAVVGPLQVSATPPSAERPSEASPDAHDEGPLAARVRWWLVLSAAGLAAWTDVIAGFAAAALILVRVASWPTPALAPAPTPSRAWAKLALITVALAWLAPFLPGMLEALHHHVDPTIDQARLDALGILRPGEVRPDPALTQQLPAAMIVGLLRESGPAHALAWAAAIALAAAVFWRRRHDDDRLPARITGLLPLAMLLTGTLVASTLVHLRSRNVAFAPHLVALFAVAGLGDPRRPGQRRRKPEKHRSKPDCAGENRRG